MVKIMENPRKMDDLGVTPYFWKHPKIENPMEKNWDSPPED